jgi:hypothetical protein
VAGDGFTFAPLGLEGPTGVPAVATTDMLETFGSIAGRPDGGWVLGPFLRDPGTRRSVVLQGCSG